jgi:hypothetical protein
MIIITTFIMGFHAYAEDDSIIINADILYLNQIKA